MNRVESTARKRVVLATFGSLGDLHPYLALALGLRARGHEPILATAESYRQRVEPLGLGFHAVRPDLVDDAAAPAAMARVMDSRGGTVAVIRDHVMSPIRESYADTLAAAAGADLLISHPITPAVRLVAETTGVPWVSSLLHPIGIFSVHDPPVLAPVPWLAKLRGLGPAFHRPLFHLMRRITRSWSEPWHRLRAELGLPPTADDPVFEGQHAPLLVLGLFSPLLAAKQSDWPPQTVITGFCFFNQGDDSLPPDLARFLAAGPPPLVFTLGSAAVFDAGAFFRQSVEAADRLGRRAVLLVGRDPRNRPASLPDGVIAINYVPYAAIFPRAAAIIHQGGVGTTAEAMRAGKPMLVMPYAHDQFDNAFRMRRLGIGRTIDRRRYSGARAAAELARLLDDAGVAARAAAIGERITREDGVASACDAIADVMFGTTCA